MKKGYTLRYFLIFLLVVCLAVCGVGLYAWNDFRSPTDLAENTKVILPRGSGFVKSVEILAENKIIAHPDIFKAIAYLNGDAHRIKAGEYKFPAAVSPQAVLKILVEGQVVVHKITIAEGLNVREVTELLMADDVLTGDVPAGLKEGSLFPETYHFTYGDTRESVIVRMQDKMQKTLDELWEKRSGKIPIKTKEEALVLASIVEKETGVASERKRVAGVFINRLNKNMRLQSDPTVAYGIEKTTGKPLERPLIILDLKTPTPYNTYEIDALPPEPIANPSKEAIEAVLHPMPTNELYFVATGTGGHNFAATLDEHNKNVRAYRAKLKE